MSTTAQALAEQLEAELHGDPARIVRNVRSIDTAGLEDLTFFSDAANLKKLSQCGAGTVILNRALWDSLTDDLDERTFLLVDDPLSSFSEAALLLRPQRPRPEIGISTKAHVSLTAVIGAKTNIHPGAHVGDGAVVGDGCEIHPGVVIGTDCRIGDNAILYPNVVLYPNVILGQRVIIHASSVIGADGFGYRLIDGRHCKIPQLGIVRVEDDVEIGACTTIDRAMIGETVIGEGTKLDNLVMIAHNCKLGKHNTFVSQVGMAGSVTTGEYVVCAGQVGIGDHVHLGDRAIFGAMAGIHRDMPGDETYLGVPAVPKAEAARMLIAQMKVPEMRKQIRRLESKVNELTARLEQDSDNEPPAIKAAA